MMYMMRGGSSKCCGVFCPDLPSTLRVPDTVSIGRGREGRGAAVIFGYDASLCVFIFYFSDSS